jgi:hypothetical protein
MLHHKKYLKYKAKYESIKRKINNDNHNELEKKQKNDSESESESEFESESESESEFESESESDTETEYGFDTETGDFFTEDIEINDDDVIEEDFGVKRFNIVSHGSFYNDKRIDYIRIPKIRGYDVFIFFHGLDKEECSDYGDPHCYSNESYTDFKVAEDTEDINFKGRKYVNKYGSDNIIKDYHLSFDEDREYNFIDFCQGTDIRKVKYPNKKSFFLSEIIIKLKRFIETNNIDGPYYIYCFFCLVEYKPKRNDKYVLNYIESKKLYSSSENSIFVPQGFVELSPPLIE